MKQKVDKGIISSWDAYAHNTVSEYLCVSCFMSLYFYLLTCTLLRNASGFITGSSCNLWTHYLQSLSTTIYVRRDWMVPCVLSSNITIGIGLSVASTMSWNLSITTVMGTYQLLDWSGLERVLRSKAGVAISSLALEAIECWMYVFSDIIK